jgi:phosphoserine phosphatase
MVLLAVQHGAGMADALSIIPSQRLDKAQTDRIFVTNGKVHELDRAGVVPLDPCRFVLPLLESRAMFQSPAASFRLIFFDCDSTLTTIEGIDELARLKGQYDHIADLTRRAMNGEIKLEEVFATRLDLLRPTRADLRCIAQAYREAIVPDSKETIAALRYAGCEVYLVSGGLLPAVQEFARALGLPTRYVRAVPIQFDQLSGQWWRYELDRYGGNPDERYLSLPPTPLIETQGKRQIIAELSGAEKRTMLVGDGVTDLEARDAVKLFVGFGGVVKRDRVTAEAAVYISANSMAPIVPLALSTQDAEKLQHSEHAPVLHHGLELIEEHQVHFHIKSAR